MRVFISWSGKEAGAMASTVKSWLEEVFAGRVEPFLSKGIQKGARGLDAIALELSASDFGIVILTRDSVDSQWLNFEAGALSKGLGEARVAPLLLGVQQTDVTGPLTQFQMTVANARQDVEALASSINDSLNEPLPARSLQTLFDASWPAFSEAVEANSKGSTPRPRRSTEDLMEEILLRVRQLGRGMSDIRSAVSEDWEREVLDQLSFAFPVAIGGRFRYSDGRSSLLVTPGKGFKLSSEEFDHSLVSEIASGRGISITIVTDDGIRTFGSRPAGLVENRLRVNHRYSEPELPNE